MVSLDTWHRLRKYGITRLFISVDFLLPLLGILVAWWLDLINLTPEQSSDLVSGISTVSGTLIGVVLTGIAIIVALSDEQFLEFINDSDEIYDRLLFIFEYTVLLAIIVSVFGVFSQVTGTNRSEIHILLFLFAHLILSVLTLVSVLITYGKKKAEYTAINNIEPEEVELDVPERFIKGESGDEGGDSKGSE